MLSIVRLSDCQLRKFGYDTEFMCHPASGRDSPTATSSSGARYGNGRRSIARTQLKIVALTPMPSPRHRTAAMEKAGLLTRVLNAYRRSDSMEIGVGWADVGRYDREFPEKVSEG